MSASARRATTPGSKFTQSKACNDPEFNVWCVYGQHSTLPGVKLAGVDENRIHEAGNGKEALERAISEDFDAVLPASAS